MEFGKLTNIEHIQWTLPPEDPLSEKFLKLIPKTHFSTDFRIGTPAWGRREWLGKLYPAGTPANEFLYHYARVRASSASFKTLELNSSHYRIPTSEQIQKWREQVPETFLFCPKLFQGITHDLGGLTDTVVLQLWYKSLEDFGDNLGPCFAQFPPSFDYSFRAELYNFLKQWPDDCELALEFRHPSWFKDGHLLPALSEYLHKRMIGSVITDVAGRRDVLHSSVTSVFTFVRFIGNNLHPSDLIRLHQWAARLKKWKEEGLAQVFFMVHQPNDILAPEMARHVVDEFNRECDANLKQLQLLTLF